MDYITLKRFELDKILEQSPDIPITIITKFNTTFNHLNIHKPDPVIGLQTILPFGKSRQYNRLNYISLNDKILLLKCFTDWKVKTKYTLYKKGGKEADVLIEITNSRQSNTKDNIEVEGGIELNERDATHLMLHGTLSQQKQFVQNRNIKIKKPPLKCPSNKINDEHIKNLSN